MFYGMDSNDDGLTAWRVNIFLCGILDGVKFAIKSGMGERAKLEKRCPERPQLELRYTVQWGFTSP